MKAPTCGESTDEVTESYIPDRVEPASATARPSMFPAVTVGRIVSISPDSGYLVDFPANETGELLHARSLVALDEAQLGREAALVFEEGDRTRPIVVGVFADSNRIESARREITHSAATTDSGCETMVLTAGREITLQCGKASITLTSAGKVLLRGAYLLSRSSGVNRIKGGSVQIN